MLSKIKNVSLIIIIFSLLLSSSSPLYAIPSWLHVNGNQIEDPNGNVIVLRGISLPDLGYLDSSYDDMNALELIDKITDTDSTEGASPGWYPKIVRIPIYPPQTVAEAPYYWDPANPDDFYNDYIRPVVDYCGEKNLYVIIDWHQTDNTYDEIADTNTFWTYMAQKFAGDSHVLFEIFNEPTNDVGTESENWDSVRTDMQTWVDIVRTYAPDNIILVGTPNECTILGPVIGNPIADNNIVYVAHIFPSQWQGGTEEIDLDSISQCAEIYPVFVSEWGYMATADIDLQRYNGTKAEYGLPLKDFLEEYGISNTACVAAYDWNPPMFRRNWTNQNSSATEMGRFAKDWLYEKSGIVNTSETTTLKCKIKAGKTQFAQQGPDANDINKMKDAFKFSGTYATKPLLLASITEMDINIVSLDYNEIIYSENIDFNSLDVVNSKFRYSYKIPKGHAGAITSLKINFEYQTFSIKAKKTDLTGLGAPLQLNIVLGNNILSSEVNETIINKSKIIPTRLMRLYDDKLVVTRTRISSSIYPLSDSLSIKGDIAVEDMDLDANEPNLVNVDVNFIWGDQTFTVPAGNFIASKKGHYYKCRKVPMDINDCNAGLVTAKINLDKCIFKASVKKADDLDIGLDDSLVRFRINFGDDDFNQPADVNIVTGRSY